MIFLLFIIKTEALSNNYLIPSYYGSRELDFPVKDSIINGNLSSFYWYSRVYLDNETYYVAADNAIYQIQGNVRKLIAGEASKSGYRDGDASNSLFGKITSLIYFKKNETAAQLEIYKTTVILTNNNTVCQSVDITNYYSCQNNESLTKEIDPSLIKDLYPNNLQINQIDHQPYLFISDSSNNCIRKLDINNMIVNTFAGICQQSGFKDGILGVNKFNTPDQMGIDVLGNLFVYDSQNHFIRLITPDGTVKTLINGSCRQDIRYDNLLYQNFEMRRVICLKNWIKISGQPSEHLVTENYNICTQNYLDCQ